MGTWSNPTAQQLALIIAAITATATLTWVGTQTFNGATIFNSGVCSGYSICIRADGTQFYEINGTTNKIMLTSSTNASAIFQDAANNMNNTSITQGASTNETRQGGSIKVLSGVYPITHQITIPNQGNVTWIGEGQSTILYVPSGHSNYIFAYQSNSTTTGFGFTFRDMWLHSSLTALAPSSAFYFTGSHNPSDVLLDNVWISGFPGYGFYSVAAMWNYNLDHVVCEFTTAYCISINGGADFKLENSKCLSTFGRGCLSINANSATINNNWFQANNQRGINLAGASNIIITSNRFGQNGQGADNFYFDIECSGSKNVQVLVFIGMIFPSSFLVLCVNIDMVRY